MDLNKKGKTSNSLSCDVCKIDFNSNGEYALHEFSKKHCDNLIRLSKQKPIVSKQKTKAESSQPEKEIPKFNTVTHTGSFTKYGYFVPGEIYTTANASKEYNTDYDSYAQKFAENLCKEKPSLPPHSEASFLPSTSLFKKKKKKIKSCQVCNVTLTTVPEYEAHMKSPHHIWKLKVTGMGVSAHFVKASTDLHTTDMNEDPIPNQTEEKPAGTVSENSFSGPFPLLYCNDCELLLNSPQQYNLHINGKSHLECAQKKIELKAKKEKLENPSPNQLYCYSCKILLNNLFQYNEHKNGKKHKAKCKILIKSGITIPPEERVPGIPLPDLRKRVVYPELYEKFVLEKQKQEGEHTLDSNINENNVDSQKSEENSRSVKGETITEAKIFHKNQLENVSSTEDLDVPEEPVTIKPDEPVKCTICSESFQWQSQLDVHLGTEDHLKKILDLKQTGKPDTEILKTMFSDRKVVKPNNLGKLICSICNVTADNDVEFSQHLNSIVHKYTEKDYKIKKTFEVKCMVGCNEQGLYYCKLCKEGWPSLSDYSQHLHFAKHKSVQRAQSLKSVLAKRRTSQKFMILRKKQSFLRSKIERNPGVRTKVCGVAVDLQSGAQVTIPNLEPLEPKIDITKNVSIGATEKITDDAIDRLAESDTSKKREVISANRTLNPPFPSTGNASPLIRGPPFQPRYSRHGYGPAGRNLPYSSFYPPFCGRPPMGHPYFRSPWFQRPPRPRYR